jgi:hypothetical protein
MVTGLFSKYLRFSFNRRDKGVRVTILERPGKWMNENNLSQLLEDLRTVVKDSLQGSSLNYGVLSGDPYFLRNTVLTVVYDLKTNKPIAFNALSYLSCELHGKKTDVLHLGLVVVSPCSRARGLSCILYSFTTMLLFIRGLCRPIWISNVTQVPAIFGQVCQNFENVFPRPGAHKPPASHLTLARQIVQKHRRAFGVGEDAVFDESSFIILDAYTGGSDNLKKTLSQAQPHRDSLYNQYCAHSLDYSRGDDFLQLGSITLTACFRHLQSQWRLPKKVPLSLASLREALFPKAG